jgi:hypothetical protein
VDLFWDDVPELVGRRIRTVRYTALGTILGEALVVIVCSDGTLVRLKCTDLGCEVAEVLLGSETEDEE